MEEKKTQTADKGAALRDVPKVHENAEAPGEAEVTELKKAAAKGEGKQKSSANMLAAKLKTRKLRMAVGTVVFVGMAAGLIAGVSMGTLSGFGWDTFSLLCPLGALGTMIATKTVE